MSGRYYIRARGRKNGPLSLEQLHSLARRGRFGRHYEVSTDGKHWEAAGNYPELFPFGLDDDLGDPLDDELPRRGRRRSRSSEMDDDDFHAPPPVGFDDLYSDEPESKPKRKSRRTRAHEAENDESIPLVDDSDEHDVLEVDVRLEVDTEPRRRRGGKSKSTRETDEPLWEEEEQPAPRRKRRGRQSPSEEPQAVEPTEASEPAAQSVEPDAEQEPEKNSGGFFSWFRRKEKPEVLSPHVQELHDMSDRLRQESFDLDDITLVGSRRQEIAVGGHHHDDGDGIRTLGLLIMIAYQTRSTDIHLEPKIEGYDARMRVDGMLVPIVHLPKEVAGRVSGVVKVLCNIDFAGQLQIQEGSFSAAAPNRRTDFRVSFTPSIHGPKLAIRVLDVANSPQSLDGLGAPKQVKQKLKRVMQQNAGMILMCGPTGSGKTTTLYSLIRGIDRSSRNVMTIEDPVEYQIEGVTQTSVDAERGKNFSDILRALLRQDPDVLLLGEIRDAESARIAMQATMTGHLVLSTVHAQDTVNTVFRLLDLGADANLVASSLNLVLAQRLVRVLCQHCRKRRRPNPRETQRLGKLARDMIYEAAGCNICLGTGFTGRRAIFELMETNAQLKDVMLKSPTLKQLKAAAQQPGFVSLRQHGHQLVADGVTTFAEIDRVIGVEY